MDLINTWISILKKPEETVREEKENANLSRAIQNYAIGGAIIGIPIGLVVSLIGLVASSFAPQLPAFLSTLLTWGIVLIPVLVILLALLLSVILNGGLWIAVKAMKEEPGEFFTKQYYLLSLIVPPYVGLLAGAYLVSLVLMMIPLGFLLGAAVLGFGFGYLGIINVMVVVSVLKELHGFTTHQAAIAWGLSVAIFSLITVLIYLVVMLVLIFSVIGSMGALSSTAPTGFLPLAG